MKNIKNNIIEVLNKKKLTLLLSLPLIVNAQVLSPNGTSGVGVVPAATVIQSGYTTISYDQSVPGAPINKGYNTQIGVGLYDGLELVGRLASNDLHCNMFKKDACPEGTIRDFSASIKWNISSKWLEQNNANFSIGVTDLGGAASYFKSYYAVASKTLGPVEISMGQAKAKSNLALLNGSFASMSYRPSSWLDLNLQKIGTHSWSVASVQQEIPYTNARGYIALNHRMSDQPVTAKQWLGVGISLPLDGTVSPEKLSQKENSLIAEKSNKSVVNRRPEDLYELMETNGFFRPQISNYQNLLRLEIENTAYAWNTMDAVGVALSALASTHGNLEGQKFELSVTTRGISQAVISGDVPCLKRWIEAGEVCGSLSIRSGLQRVRSNTLEDGNDVSKFFSQNNRYFRPELVISPTIVSAIGTEYGSFDMDGGININVVLPLWTGAVIETNRVKPLGVSTRNFEQGGVFYSSRLKQTTSRTLFHQIVNAPSINTQARLSLGTAYSSWDGYQLETTTQSDNGRHRLGITSGNFRNDNLQNNGQKNYELTTYRYAHDDMLTTTTEITNGKYWGGDRGWSLGQKFWHGDTSLNVYIRRTRMAESAPLVSFAGFQFSVPLTPRVNKGSQYFALRGTNQWSYAVESRILDKENLITGGYGEVPRMGDSLAQTFNRDRNATRYFEAGLLKVKSSIKDLSSE